MLLVCSPLALWFFVKHAKHQTRTVMVPLLDLRHSRTARTSRSNTRTNPTTTRLAEHDERDDRGSRVPSPGKPEESNRGLGLTAAFLAVKAPVGDFVVDGVVLEPVLAVCRLTIQYR